METLPSLLGQQPLQRRTTLAPPGGQALRSLGERKPARTWDSGQPGAPGRKGVQVSSGRPLGPKAGEFSECSLHREHEAAREGPRTG